MLVVPVALVLVVVLVMGLTRLGSAARDQGRAQALADLAALAAAAHGPGAAARVAAVNRAELVRVETGVDGRVQVTVTFGGARAMAAAAT